MRRGTFAAGLVLAVGALLAPADAAWGASDPFVGSWTSSDVGDGSTQYLTIQGSGARGHHSVFLYDTVASQACAGGPANVVGSGRIIDDALTWSFTVTCPGGGKGPVSGRVGPGFFTYDEGTDTLMDDTGAVWSRL